MTESDYRIVGVGSGLSASLARTFGKVGMTVALAARRAANLTVLAQATGAKGFACDATNRAEDAKLFSDLEVALGAPDVVVCNVSYRARGQIVELNPDEGAKSLAVTAFGAFLVAQEAAKRILPHTHGQSFSPALPPA
jgi:NAD(P)-dependent dehydrogenase (short-subunit alcohol dehydrogenase family)